MYSIGVILKGDNKTGIIDCDPTFSKRGANKAGGDFMLKINQSQISAGEKSQIKADFIPISGNVQGSLALSQPVQQVAVTAKNGKTKRKVKKVSGVTIFELNSPKQSQIASLAVSY